MVNVSTGLSAGLLQHMTIWCLMTGNEKWLHVQMGTIAWAAPELLRNFRIGADSQHRTVSHKADVFRYRNAQAPLLRRLKRRYSP